MSNIGDLIAFRAALELCRDEACRVSEYDVSIEEIYRKCVAQQFTPDFCPPRKGYDLGC